MQTILLDDFIDDGIIKEKSFRAKVDNMDFDKYFISSILNVPLDAILVVTED